MKYPNSIQKLIDEFSNLPTVGPKTAERYVFYLLKQNPEKLRDFSKAIAELRDGIKICKRCLGVANSDPCEICLDDKRDISTICVIANTRDMQSIESSKEFNGVYHVLGGIINSIENQGPDKLTINQLLNRIKNENIQEVILALNPTIEGETTSMYIAKLLRPTKIKITRIARGLPMGSDIEYADEITITNSLKYRNEI